MFSEKNVNCNNMYIRKKRYKTTKNTCHHSKVTVSLVFYARAEIRSFEVRHRCFALVWWIEDDTGMGSMQWKCL
jgi:hypothetical protein